MGFFISAMLSARGRAYLPETEGRGQMCTFDIYKYIYIVFACSV